MSHMSTGHFLFQQVSLSPLSGLSWQGIPFLSKFHPHFSFCLWEMGLCMGCVLKNQTSQGGSLLPGTRSPSPPTQLQAPGEAGGAGGSGGEGLRCGGSFSQTRNSEHWLHPASGALLITARGKRGQLLCASSALNTGSELFRGRKEFIPSSRKAREIPVPQWVCSRALRAKPRDRPRHQR